MTAEQEIAGELTKLLGRGVRIASDSGTIEVLENRRAGVIVVDLKGIIYVVTLVVTRRQ